MSRKTLLNRLPLAVFGLLLFTPLRPVALGTGLGRAAAPTAPAATPVVAVRAAAGGLHLVTADGKPLDLNRFRGKAVFVNLWATWCPPCRAEMPGIQALYERTDTSKVAFVLISLDRSPEKAQKFVLRQGFSFPIYFPAAPLPPPFDSQTIPSTIILSPDGRVAARYEGLVDYDTPEFQQALEQLATRQ
ncbi:TlpA family protein disulfide reductase [Hymenobacter aerophilus]|uniref:TlpA family protein disulfide reductase n=1 Tax=Hymenobacter aerophilus TaxID=119644 RepID=UPI0003651A7A|nr:TlpA disulfide reductase family protein [Hymenobacter aerophilus]